MNPSEAFISRVQPGEWTWEIKTGEVVWSREVYRIFGYDPAQPPPPWDDQRLLYTPESFSSLEQALLHCLTTGEGYRLSLEAVDRAGAIVPVEVQGIGMLDQHGDVMQIRGRILVRNPAEVSTVEAPLRILLVEDNPSNQKLCVLFLAKLGCSADLASDGVEAVEAVMARSYDVIFMDVQMPRMDGMDACRTIRRELPESKQPWIIALTAHTFEADRIACYASGMNDFLTKPIRRDLLEAALRRAREALRERVSG